MLKFFQESAFYLVCIQNLCFQLNWYGSIQLEILNEKQAFLRPVPVSYEMGHRFETQHVCPLNWRSS